MSESDSELLTNIPQARDFSDAAAWVAELEAYGLANGAKPPGIFGICTLDHGFNGAFWRETTRLGRLAPLDGNLSVGKQLERAWEYARV